jgi:hypothetical protein
VTLVEGEDFAFMVRRGQSGRRIPIQSHTGVAYIVGCATAERLQCVSQLREAGPVCRRGPKKLPDSYSQVPLGKRDLLVSKRPLDAHNCSSTVTTFEASAALSRPM